MPIRNDASTELPPPPPSVTIIEAKDRLSRLVAQVRAHDHSAVAITSRGKPQAGLIPTSRYRRHVVAPWRQCLDQTPPDAYPALIEAPIEENARLLGQGANRAVCDDGDATA